VTFNFDRLTSKSDQFVFVTKFNQVVNLVKFTQAVCNISCKQTFGLHDHARMSARTARKQNAFNGWSPTKA